MEDIKEGDVFRASYPFIRDEYEEMDQDGIHKIKTWIPGVRHEWCGPEDTEAVADAMGEIVLTVVSVHKPGHYPTRVFFTRRWADPKGREFGKTKCRCTTLQAFRRYVRGYEHEYRMATAEEQAEETVKQGGATIRLRHEHNGVATSEG
jgi:hypothetical protein